MLSAGDKLGEYRIESLVGQGGIGTVYKARDLRDDSVVALKVINEDLAESAEYRQTLANEREVASRIDSPYIVKVHDFVEVNGSCFIAQEFVEGNEFREVCGDWSFEQKVDTARKLAEGISAAHLKAVVHRDLKPENVRITTEGDPKILDFGLATVEQTDSVDAAGDVEGTVLYASPEQLSGEVVSARSDLFSFGVILYELFAGRRPFEGAYSASIMYSILYEAPEGPQEIDPTLPEWLCDLIVHLLQKLPDERPESAHEIAEAFQRNLGVSGAGDVAVGISRRHRTVTVVDLKNLSGDESWDYFCLGFTEEIIGELTARTDLVISAQPSTAMPRNIGEVFKRCRSDFVITGSLLKWQDQIRLSLGVFGDQGENVVSNRKYEGSAEGLFGLLSEAANEAAKALAEATGTSTTTTAEGVTPDVSAYDFYLKGHSYYQTNRPDDLKFAEDMFQRALEIDPNFALAHTGLSDVYAFQYMAYYERTPERIAAACQASDKALQINPQLPEGHRSTGRCCMFTGDMKAAEESFKKAVEFNPKYAVGYRTLAWLKSMEGDLDAALKWAGKALQLAPTDLETLLLISLTHMDARKFTLALATLQRAIELGPDYGRAYYLLGTVYMRLGVPDLALENLLEAIKYQGDPNCYNDAGYIYLIKNDCDSARVRFNESIKAGQFDFIAWHYLGMVERHCGNESEAKNCFEKCLASIEGQDPSEEWNVDLLAYKALAMASMGNSEIARELLEEVASAEKHSGEVHYCMARSYAILGDETRSLQCLEEAYQHHDGPTPKEAALDPLLKIH